MPPHPPSHRRVLASLVCGVSAAVVTLVVVELAGDVTHGAAPSSSAPIALSDGTASTVRSTAPRTTPPIAPPTTTSPPPPTSRPATPPPTPSPPTPPPPTPSPAPPTSPPGSPQPWDETTRTTEAGYVVTDVGCIADRSPDALDAFFGERFGPAIGLDYQHVYDLGDDRYLWLFQDAFLDHSGEATSLGQASFAHNLAMVQTGTCFEVFHRGTPDAPISFEPGDGETVLSRWFWPLGGELSGGRLMVFWAEMEFAGAHPGPGDGLGWHPVRTWLATYDADTLARDRFEPAPNSDVTPIYGFAVASDETHTYLFGNTFDHDLARQGGFYGGPHSATAMWLARTPRGSLDSAPEYWTSTGWSADPAAAAPILTRYWTENPMQPRFLDGRWVAATKVDGYWGDDLAIDVAPEPSGPWETVSRHSLAPRDGDPLMNTYHAHLMPWSDGGALVVSVSQNAQDMARDAWRHPHRYRPQFVAGR